MSGDGEALLLSFHRLQDPLLQEEEIFLGGYVTTTSTTKYLSRVCGCYREKEQPAECQVTCLGYLPPVNKSGQKLCE